MRKVFIFCGRYLRTLFWEHYYRATIKRHSDNDRHLRAVPFGYPYFHHHPFFIIKRKRMGKSYTPTTWKSLKHVDLFSKHIVLNSVHIII